MRLFFLLFPSAAVPGALFAPLLLLLRFVRLGPLLLMLRRRFDMYVLAGIVYISRIPPFMKPARMKQLLGKFGEIGRLYLAPEGDLAPVAPRARPAAAAISRACAKAH